MTKVPAEAMVWSPFTVQKHVLAFIKICESEGHRQTVAVSTHMNRLTQVCFTCLMVRTAPLEDPEP